MATIKAPTIKVKDLAFGRLRSPDLDQAEEFLTHFGMSRRAHADGTLHARDGRGPSSARE